MKTFTMERQYDETGVSGTGIVLEGAVFTDGTVCGRWLTQPGSFVLWDSFKHFWEVHVAPHRKNQTVVRFSDGDVLEQSYYSSTPLLRTGQVTK